jgi:hypothetical protein
MTTITPQAIYQATLRDRVGVPIVNATMSVFLSHRYRETARAAIVVGMVTATRDVFAERATPPQDTSLQTGCRGSSCGVSSDDLDRQGCATKERCVGPRGTDQDCCSPRGAR